MLYATQYMDGFLNLLEADSYAQAEKLTLRRHLGESVLPYLAGAPVSAYIEPLHPRSENGQAIHQAVFLAYVGLKAGALTLEETLGDNGLVHQLSHDLHFGDRGPDLIMPRFRMAAMYDEQRRRVPGWPRF